MFNLWLIKGKCRAIGLSDVVLENLVPLYEAARIKPAVVKRHRNSTWSSADPMTVMAEQARMMFDLLPKLAVAVAANVEAQRKFMTAVLIRLSKIETILTEVHGYQLVQCWPPGRVSGEQRDKYVQEVEERVSRTSEQLRLKMVRYIYGETEMPERRHDRRRKCWGWEI